MISLEGWEDNLIISDKRFIVNGNDSIYTEGGTSKQTIR